MDDSPWMPPNAAPNDTPDAGDPAIPRTADQADELADAEALVTTPPATVGSIPEPVLPAPVLPEPAPSLAAPESPWSREGGQPAVVPTLPPALPVTVPVISSPLAPPFVPLSPPLSVPIAPNGRLDPAAFGQPPFAGQVELGATGAGGGRSGRSKLLVGSAVVAVLAIGATGVFAVSRFTGRADGGAADPNELGVTLMNAIENEDVLGMMDVLAPGERDLFRQPAIDLVSELSRLGVLSADADLAGIAGLDVVLENEAVEVEATNVDDIVNVQMVADATVTVDGSVVPVGDLVIDNMDPDAVSEMRDTVETTDADFDVTLTAVQDDGRWYFSLFHTVAETARRDALPGSDIPLTGIGAVGADTPEAAVDQLLDSVEALDLELMMQSLNPGEAAALQRYAPLFLDDAQSALAEVPLDWTITTREFRVEGDGSRRTVFIDALGIEGTIDGEAFTLGIDGDCFSAQIADRSIEQCTSDVVASTELDDLLSEAPTVKEFVDAATAAFSDVAPIGLELRQYDGAWYTSPVSTLSEAVLKVLRALDRDEIDRLIELGESAAAEAIDVVLGDFGAGLGGLDQFTTDDLITGDMSSDDMSGDDMVTDDMSSDDMNGDDMVTDDGMTSDDTYAAPAWEACYSEADPATAATCFAQYVDSGELDPAVVPIELRFAECGYADARWTGAIYSMDDATFIATVEAVQPCFLALVESGTITEFELPSEISNLECFEGRNWYSTFDDAEYDARYWACIEAAADA